MLRSHNSTKNLQKACASHAWFDYFQLEETKQ